AGDTFNTAVYLQRLGVATAYATAVGQGDPFSAGILRALDEEGLDRGLVVEAPGRLPGLYAIETEPNGERRFFYWREASPARQYMELIDVAALKAALGDAGLVYVSAISLAILGEVGRAVLTELLKDAADDGLAIALDTNYRAQLWSSPQIAADAVSDLAPHCRYLSMSTTDLTGLGLDPEVWASTWSQAGVEVVLRGEDNVIRVFASGGVERFEAPEPCAVVDTTGAGDSFNAAYLAGRLHRHAVADSIAAARCLARTVIGMRGAIIPKAAMAL
ncbi:MAG TPA: sugar kinase, partial [Caulobacteraceae bacterium]|nr:sugar kinase [Caulobacteraceae bacterium]